MKGIRHELATLATVLAVPAALALVFPYGAIGFRPASRAEASRSSAAFVEMTMEEQEAAMRAAKTSWQVDSGNARRLRADLSVGVLPEDVSPISLDAVIGPSRSAVPVVPYGPEAHPRSLAAPAARRIANDVKPEAAPPAFPKEDLLKLD